MSANSTRKIGLGEGGSSRRSVRNIRAGLGCLGNEAVLNKVTEHWSSKWDPWSRVGFIPLNVYPALWNRKPVLVWVEECPGNHGIG